MLVSTETSNNGSSCPEPDLGSYQMKLNVLIWEVAHNHQLKNNVLLFGLNVTLREFLLESVMILHSLISIMKSNLSMYHKENLFTCTTCLASMV